MPAGASSFLLPVLMFGALGAMMFFSIRKQKRQAAAQKNMQAAIIPGTRVMTTSGLHGTVTAVADDTIELEVSPGVYTTWVRAAVREVVVPAPGPVIEDTEPVEEIDEVTTREDSRPLLEKRPKDIG